jgi:predicted nucleic-acid-binding protein
LKITADTNVIVRAVVADNPRQSALALDMLVQAEVVAIPVPALCEFVWVLSQGYDFAAAEIGAAIRKLVASANVITNHPAVDAGLDFMDSGGDFADGVIAYEGQWLGGATFVSFDRKAVAIAQASGSAAQLLVVTPERSERAGIARGARKTGYRDRKDRC